MENFECKVRVEGLKDTYKIGETVSVTAEVESTASEIKSISFSVPAYDVYERFVKIGDNRYAFEFSVPYEADPGSYNISFKAIDVDGDRFEFFKAKVTVTN